MIKLQCVKKVLGVSKEKFDCFSTNVNSHYQFLNTISYNVRLRI